MKATRGTLLPFLLTAIILLLLVQQTIAQQYIPRAERGDPAARRKTNIDTNNVRTTIFNFGQSGRTGAIPDEVPFEWPKNTKRYYVALAAPFVGGEVSLPDSSIIHIVDVPNYRQSPLGASWNFEPVPGYQNPSSNSIARSDDPTTWPGVWPDKDGDLSDPGWAGKWNGVLGKNKFINGTEFYFHFSDDRYNRYTYVPDTTDPTRKGLGIVVSRRVLEPVDFPLSDVVLYIDDIYNAGTKDIPRAGYTSWIADFVGGDIDAYNNHMFFDIRRSTLYFTDNGTGGTPFLNDKVGVAAMAFLKTPGNIHDRIDNDNNGEPGGPILDPTWLAGEIPYDNIDNNHNGLIDENLSYITFGDGAYRQNGVTIADGIDNNGNGESGSPVVTQQMIDEAAADTVTINGYTRHWHRWPPNPESDPMQQGLDGQPIIHLIDVIQADLGMKFKDNIDNDGNCTDDLPAITQAMIDSASHDKYNRYRFPGTNIVLYNVTQTSLGKKYINSDTTRSAGIDEGIDEGIDNPGGDDIGLTRVLYLAAGAINFSTTADIYFWANFMIPAVQELEFYDPSLNLNGDYDAFASCDQFPIKAGSFQRIVSAIVLGRDTANASRKVDYAKAYAGAGYTAHSVSLSFVAPAANDTLKNQAAVQWNTVPTDISAKADLYISSDDGDHWQLLTRGVSGGNSFAFATGNYRDGIFYRIMAISYSDSNLGYAVSPRFVINNPGPANPEFRFDKSMGSKFSGISSIRWDAGDADGDQVRISLFYRTGLADSVHLLDSNVANTGIYQYNTLPLPNAGTYYLEANITDGVLTGSDNFGPFAINNTRYGLGDSTSIQRNTSGSGTIEVHIADTTQLTGDTYKVTFSNSSDSIITFSVKDMTKGDTVLQLSPPVINGTEGPLFDGMRLLVNNDTLAFNQAASHWNRNTVHSARLNLFRYSFFNGTPEDADYTIIIGDAGIDTSVAVKFKVSSNRWLTLPSMPVNFEVINSRTHQPVPFAFWEISGNAGVLHADSLESDIIILLKKIPQDSLVPTWEIDFAVTSTSVNPQSGDSLYLYLNKPFQTGDEYTFKALKGSIMAVRSRQQQPLAYELSQNYPNPFNPETEIRFALTSAQTVHLDIYNILGQKVRSLIDDRREAGSYFIRWDGKNAAGQTVGSGVYFYRINAGPFTQVRKMLLMR